MPQQEPDENVIPLRREPSPEPFEPQRLPSRLLWDLLNPTPLPSPDRKKGGKR